MRTRVALIGSVAAMKLPTLERMVQVPVVFDIVPDTSCVERVRAAISTAEVVVTRRWPSDPVAAPKLRLIQHVGAGTDSYHRDSLPPTAYLCNVYEHEASIAEHVFMVLFALRRSLFALDRNLRHGDWSRNQNGQAQLLGDLSGLTLGIIGFGRIGRSLVFPAQAFDMEIIGVTGKPVRGDPPDGLRFLGGPEDLDLVLKDSDVLVVSVPLNEWTRHLIAKYEFELMKPTAVLINVARGPIIDEAALYQALSTKRIAGAAIDVWYRHPTDSQPCLPSHYPIQELNNTILTPHIAGWSRRTLERRGEFIAKNIDRIVKGESPLNIVWEPLNGASSA